MLLIAVDKEIQLSSGVGQESFAPVYVDLAKENYDYSWPDG